jgi:agmatine deiminase
MYNRTTKLIVWTTMSLLLLSGCAEHDASTNNTSIEALYTMPTEDEPHEGTWLQWPHHYEYDDGVTFRDRMDPTWVAMTKALVTSEKVHIIAYDSVEKDRISQLLTNANVPLANVDFFIFPTNDVWARDNGPIFVREKSGKLLIQDWGFNGWGGRDNYELDDPIPTSIGNAIGIQVVDLNSIMTNEGGAVEMDGNGVLMASRSSILSQRPPNTVRNPGMTQSQAEKIFTKYLGIKKFIWLDGWVNDPDDPTDAHIDGFARFANASTIITMNSEDLDYWGLSDTDISTLFSATNIDNVPYDFVYLPLTQNDVVTAYGKDLEYKGSYQNFYVANTVVLVPNYNDPNDAVANNIIQGLYPGRTVIGIDVRNLYEQGGMIHCVTQQQPQ